MKKRFLCLFAGLGMIISSAVLAEYTTNVHMQNNTGYCGETYVGYGPADHPTWDGIAFQLIPFDKTSTHDMQSFLSDYVLGFVQLRYRSNCQGTKLPQQTVNCQINVAKPLPRDFTIKVNTQNQISCIASN